jgi:hypothetical protein
MKLTLSCPRASYDREMRITCSAGGLCGHQRYKPCKGWCVLTDQAGRCPLRKDDGHGEGHETAADRGDAVRNP